MESCIAIVLFGAFWVFIYIAVLRSDIKNLENRNKKNNDDSSKMCNFVVTLYKRFFELKRPYLKCEIYPDHCITMITNIIEKLQSDYKNTTECLKQEGNKQIDIIKNERCSEKLYRLAESIAEKELEDFDNLVVHLECKDRPALSSAQKVKEAKEKAKEFEIKYKMMKYEYDLLFEIFPELENYIDYGDGEEELAIVKKYFDRTSNWVTKEEYDKLSEPERNQLALDRYIENFSKTKWQIGRDYEMSIAHKYREQGYDIEYTGIIERLNDKGRDIIAKKDDEILIIQCKYWSKEKIIHEKHICQLYGTAIMYQREYNLNKKVIPVFVTQTQLSDTARDFAKYLNVVVLENEPLREFPRIKCNIGKGGEKIYHLPFDQQYDNTKIETKKGESFEFTVVQAELKGFRRAKKWHYT